MGGSSCLHCTLVAPCSDSQAQVAFCTHHWPTPSPFCPSYPHIERGPYLASSRVTPKPWRATSPAAVFPLSLLPLLLPLPLNCSLTANFCLLLRPCPHLSHPAWRGPPPTGPFGTRTNSPSQSYISRNPRGPSLHLLAPRFQKLHRESSEQDSA